MSTNPPRQREGKPFPGGKRMRKALAKLRSRIALMPSGKGRVYKTPGSMK